MDQSAERSTDVDERMRTGSPPGRGARVNPDYERLGELLVTRDDIMRFRQLDSKCPGPLDLGHRGHHGTLGPGCGHQRGHGYGGQRRETNMSVSLEKTSHPGRPGP